METASLRGLPSVPLPPLADVSRQDHPAVPAAPPAPTVEDEDEETRQCSKCYGRFSSGRLRWGVGTTDDHDVQCMLCMNSVLPSPSIAADRLLASPAGRREAAGPRHRRPRHRATRGANCPPVPQRRRAVPEAPTADNLRRCHHAADISHRTSRGVNGRPRRRVANAW